MSSHVVCKVALSSESLATTLLVAGERLFARMNSHVSLKVSFLCECFSATYNATCERLLSSLT